ncbi:GHKL domain-containing protein [Aquimarina sp. MMG015]|uniref:ATP-binding protein n=1 Tax=Aquimarina sp. MMG015 TaxID=2822689 RepID=UPI001B3A7129|nr:ATP-binding protein [Aquimarina sp. MMG015]MBQ4803646.1 GHKL domain-containing protein [Aquimarina sp. MMG015]
MTPFWLIVLICIVYLGVLFWIAYYGDKRASKKSIINNPIVYALSLTTYCTAWTFYGSVGKASTSGISFLATYLGPILLSPLWVILFKKIIRICKKEKINSISDFIATRYGKDKFLGNLITILTFLFIIPYISIQLRAISTSFNILIDFRQEESIYQETALFVAIIMSVFVILFGTRKSRAIEVNEGMISAIAFESLFKLIAFIAIGIYITYFFYDGFEDIFSKASEKNMLESINNIQKSLEGGYWDWFMLIILSFLVFILLPRQFHLIALENKNEEHVAKASWIFPLYLLMITLFVVPVAIAGKLYFGETSLNADSFILYFPLEKNNVLLATLVFLGGFAAATGMIIVETIAISTMLSSNILIPLLVNYLKVFPTSKVQKSILFCRRISIPIVLFSAYLYMTLIGKDYPLIEIGLISFVGIVQLAPSFFGGLFWKKATKAGTILGICVGFVLWFYTLLFPTLIRSGILGDISILNDGLFGINALKPYALFGLENLNKISHGFFWSIAANIFFYILGSLYTIPKGIEIQQANKFIGTKMDINDYRFRNKYNEVYFHQLYELIITFLGSERANESIQEYEEKYQKSYDNDDIVPIHFVDYMENILSDYIGNISARIAISKLLNEEPLNRNELLEILEETKEAITNSKKLTIKSDELERIQETLLKANENLKEIDQIKDEFILTISHELRTPITSIRLLSEMLYSQKDLDPDKKQVFIKTIIQESERLSILIDDTLLQEKLELGKLKWRFDDHSIYDLISNAIETIKPISINASVTIINNISNSNIIISADQTHLERVFINILMNAIKFYDPKKSEHYIKVSSFIKSNAINISIEDNGIGISNENYKKIFKTFVQIQNEKQKVKPKGSGLGLSIAKKIIQKHNGNIKVESKIEQYTRFLITLPINTNYDQT